MTPSILLVDDEKSILEALQRALTGINATFETAVSGNEAIEKVEKTNPQIVITDLRMPGMDGLKLLEKLRETHPGIQTIVITGHGSVDDAVYAMKIGAYDFITKPFKRQHIMAVVHRALEKSSLIRENVKLKEKLKKRQGKEFDVGKSREFRELLERAGQAAKSEATILLLGESGTGKEILADYIFENSLRSDGPLVKVNCAAIPETLLEAELFGHKKGSFTGAVQDRQGKFKDADGGTIFLDEIGEVPMSVQAKLLRILQEGEINPVGGSIERVDTRIIAATNKNLRKQVEEGKFREDLFYRLNVIPILVPPLRERPEDLMSLLSFFINKFCQKNKRTNLTVSADSLRLIENYPWPGNIRELENAIERAVILCRGNQITPQDLPPELNRTDEGELRFNLSSGMSMDQVEQHVIQSTLRRFDGDKVRTAEALGISLRTIYRKLNNYTTTHVHA